MIHLSLCSVGEQQVGKDCRSQIWRSQYKAVGVLFRVHPQIYLTSCVTFEKIFLLFLISFSFRVWVSISFLNRGNPPVNICQVTTGSCLLTSLSFSMTLFTSTCTHPAYLPLPRFPSCLVLNIWD